MKKVLIVDDTQDIHDLIEVLIEDYQDDNDNNSFNDSFDFDFGLDNLSMDKAPKKQANKEDEITISHAYQGDEAVSLLDDEDNSKFNLVFMDVRMPPGIDGIEALKKISSHNKQGKTMFIVCTAYMDYTKEEVIEMTNNQNVIFLRKPFSPVKFKETINKII